MIKIRRAKRKDITECARIFTESYNSLELNEKWTPDTAKVWLKYNLARQKDLFLVAVKDRRIVASAMAYIRPWWNGNVLFLEEIFVDARHRRQGIAKMLMKYLVNTAKHKYSAGLVSAVTFQDKTGFPWTMYRNMGFEKLDEFFFVGLETDEVLKYLN